MKPIDGLQHVSETSTMIDHRNTDDLALQNQMHDGCLSADGKGVLQACSASGEADRALPEPTLFSGSVKNVPAILIWVKLPMVTGFIVIVQPSFTKDPGGSHLHSHGIVTNLASSLGPAQLRLTVLTAASPKSEHSFSKMKAGQESRMCGLQANAFKVKNRA